MPLWEDLLSRDGIAVTNEAKQKLERFAGLVKTWNPMASLVSHEDEILLWDRHIVDSLSLAPWVKRCKGGEKVVLLDIGAGAGFPGIPIKVVLPDVKLVLVERSARKSGFLRHAVAHLNIGDTAIVHGEFPQCVRGVQADVITARAVERPGRVVNQIMAVLPAATPVAWFLCQSPAGAARLSAMGFHVEQIEDEWSRACLRRGQLYVVTHGQEKG